MIQGAHRLDPVLQQGINKGIVKFQAFEINLAASLWINPGPGNGEAVRLDAKLLHQCDIFAETVIAVTGDIPVIHIQHFPGNAAERIPDGQASAILLISAFNLIGCRCRSPDEFFWKKHIAHMLVPPVSVSLTNSTLSYLFLLAMRIGYPVFLKPYCKIPRTEPQAKRLVTR
ncbi:hypothetical protein D3C71_1480680 [compost metagenome]